MNYAESKITSSTFLAGLPWRLAWMSVHSEVTLRDFRRNSVFPSDISESELRSLHFVIKSGKSVGIDDLVTNGLWINFDQIKNVLLRIVNEFIEDRIISDGFETTIVNPLFKCILRSNFAFLRVLSPLNYSLSAMQRDQYHFQRHPRSYSKNAAVTRPTAIAVCWAASKTNQRWESTTERRRLSRPEAASRRATAT